MDDMEGFDKEIEESLTPYAEWLKKHALEVNEADSEATAVFAAFAADLARREEHGIMLFAHLPLLHNLSKLCFSYGYFIGKQSSLPKLVATSLGSRR